MVEIDDKWFKRAMRAADVTAQEIAAEIGKDRSLVSRIFVGRQKMKISEAKAFADVLNVPLDEVLRRAGVADEPTAQAMAPGFSDSDAAPFYSTGPINAHAKSVAEALGARPGIDVWQVKSRSMELQGLLPGDMMLVDTLAAERAKPGDTVVAQVYDNARGKVQTVVRRFEPPVLVAASADSADRRVSIVDGVNTVIKGVVTASWRSA